MAASVTNEGTVTAVRSSVVDATLLNFQPARVERIEQPVSDCSCSPPAPEFLMFQSALRGDARWDGSEWPCAPRNM
jgi:hypothetical protein